MKIKKKKKKIDKNLETQETFSIKIFELKFSNKKLKL